MVIPGYFGERLSELDDLLGSSHRGVEGDRGSAHTPRDLIHVPTERLHGSEEVTQLLYRPKTSTQQHDRVWMYVFDICRPLLDSQLLVCFVYLPQGHGHIAIENP